MTTFNFFAPIMIVVGSLAVCLDAGVAKADSLHPCTPIVAAKPTYLSCRQESDFVSIRIETIMSPAIQMCQGENYYEYQTAYVTISDAQGQEKSSQIFRHNDFSYDLLPLGDANFASIDGQFKLKSCVTPSNGAVSFGN